MHDEGASEDDREPQGLLIVWHSRTGASRALAQAAHTGALAAQGSEEARASMRLIEAAEVAPADLLGARGYIFACPENLASMSGAMKEMFDRCYYPVLGRIEGRAYATVIAAGSDGSGAQAQIDRIVTGWRLRRVAEPMIVNLEAQTPEAILAPKTVPDKRLAQCRELGEALAEGLSMGVF
ncbi:NAD(P)H-dependent oxidoreductase [Novosphingobium sp. YJ-S2-02]|uniref:NAD(P)H-dependent oxidoreductase n=1 Tax=Novosphingobium aureum TaxID=2792964 RepID=A0A931ML32_9SPHN|nr:NAD(P)H-dependent oxidoreductase [Novosphingobium aureum]MBH0113050.1 NAD(P)H-dependent oxidoreductase [Novosphingobium aureum]